MPRPPPGDLSNPGIKPTSLTSPTLAGWFSTTSLGFLLWASLVAYLIKNPPAMQETWVQSLGWEDPLEKGKATHSSDSGLENSMDCAAHGRRVRHD